jgi:ADP-ribose pyrophosphatase YjhB (NUDIX family)
MKAKSIHIDKAKQNKLFYVVANVVVYREKDQRCLILKRDENETAHPGKWVCPGGKLEWENLDINNPSRINGDVLDYEDAIERLCRREAKEEANIELQGPFKFINTNAYIRPDGIPSVSIKFAAKYMSGDIKLEQGAFTDHAWVNEREVLDYTCVLGIPEEVATTIELFK